MEPRELLASLNTQLTTIAGLMADLQARQVALKAPPPPPPVLNATAAQTDKKPSFKLKQLKEKMLDDERSLTVEERLMLAESGELLADEDLYLARLASGRELSNFELSYLKRRGLYFDGDLATASDDIPLDDARALLEEAKNAPAPRTMHEDVCDSSFNVVGKRTLTHSIAIPSGDMPDDHLELLSRLNTADRRRVHKALTREQLKAKTRVRHDLLEKARRDDLEAHREELKTSDEAQEQSKNQLNDVFRDFYGDITKELAALPSDFSESDLTKLISALQDQLDDMTDSDFTANSTNTSHIQRQVEEGHKLLNAAIDEQAGKLRAALKKRLKEEEAEDIHRSATALKTSQEDPHTYRSLHPDEFEDYNIAPDIRTMSGGGKDLVKAKTHTMTDEERKHSALTVEDGKLVRDGELHDTTDQTAYLSFGGDSDGKEMWVQTEDGTIRTGGQDELSTDLYAHEKAKSRMSKSYLTDEAERDRVGFEETVEVAHHSTLADGKGVRGAGEVEIIDGKIQSVSSASGHYQPGLDGLVEGVETMGRMGVLSRSATVESFKDNKETYRAVEVLASGSSLARLKAIHKAMKKAGEEIDPDDIADQLRDSLSGDGHDDAEIDALLSGDTTTLQDTIDDPSTPDDARKTLKAQIATMKGIAELLNWRKKRTVLGEDPVYGPAAQKIRQAYQDKKLALDDTYEQKTLALEQELAALTPDTAEHSKVDSSLFKLLRQYTKRAKTLDRQLESRLAKLGLTGEEVALILNLESVTERRRELDELKKKRGVKSALGGSLEEVMRRRREQLEKDTEENKG